MEVKEGKGESVSDWCGERLKGGKRREERQAWSGFEGTLLVVER